jgi:hypothetical protein
VVLVKQMQIQAQLVQVEQTLAVEGAELVIGELLVRVVPESL